MKTAAEGIQKFTLDFLESPDVRTEAKLIDELNQLLKINIRLRTFSSEIEKKTIQFVTDALTKVTRAESEEYSKILESLSETLSIVGFANELMDCVER